MVKICIDTKSAAPVHLNVWQKKAATAVKPNGDFPANATSVESAITQVAVAVYLLCKLNPKFAAETRGRCRLMRRRIKSSLNVCFMHMALWNHAGCSLK